MNKNIPELKQKKNLLGKFSEIFIDRYRAGYLLIVAIIIIGSLFYAQLPRESFPDSAFNASLVFMNYPGASAEDVESIITNPVERSLNNIDGVKRIQSFSEEGIARIIVNYDFDKEPDDMLTKFRAEIDKLNFPDTVTDPTIIEFSTSEIPIFRFAITGDYDLTTLKDVGEEFQKDIEALDGVTEVELSGGYERQIRVEFDFEEMAKYNIEFNTIKNIIGANNINLPGGSKALNGQNFLIRIDEEFKNLEEIRNLIISSGPNGIIRLGDIATVEDGYADPSSLSRLYVNGETEIPNEAVYLSVFREGGTDTVGIGNAIKQKIEDGRGNTYPEDMTFYIAQDDSVTVREDLNTVIDNALSGLLVVIIVLFLFIGLRESMIVATVIPLSLLLSIILMQFTGLTFNTLTLTGFIIALGMLVDNAIVIMENVDRLREKGLDKIQGAKVATNQVAPAILAATLTTVVAFIPLANLSGALGETVKSLPLTIIFALSASLFVSLTITPTLSSRLLTTYKSKSPEECRGFKYCVKRYSSIAIIFVLSIYAFMVDGEIGLLSIIMAIFFSSLMFIKLKFLDQVDDPTEHRWINNYGTYIKKLVQTQWKKRIVILVSIVVFAISLLTIPAGLIPIEAFPQEEPENFSISINTPTGYLIEDTEAVVEEFEEVLYDYDEIKSFSTSIIDASQTTQMMGGSGDASIDVELVKENQRERQASEIINEVLETFQSIPGAEFRVIEQRQAGPPATDPIQIGLQGEDLDELTEYATIYLEELKQVEGVRNPYLSAERGLEQIKINVDSNKASYYGLTSLQIAQQIRSYLQGDQLGTYKVEGDEVEIQGYINGDRIETIEDFDKIFIRNNAGQMINFNDIASIAFDQGVSVIEHDEGDRVIFINSQTFAGTNTREIISVFDERVSTIELPSSITRYERGELEDIQTLIDDVINGLIIAILLVFIVLVIQFNSLTQPIVILASVPLAFIGVVVGLIVTNNPLGAYAMMGVVALVGIAVNDAIVLVDYANYLRTVGNDKYEAISQAVRVRFIPVIATSITTMGGILPLALKNETFEQIGYAIIFGLFASTVLTLFIIPNVYIINDNFTEKIKTKFNIFMN